MILLFYGFATALVFLRLVLGPTFADRLLALDILSNISILGLVAYSIYIKSAFYLDIAIAIALISVIGTLVVTKWVKEK